MIGIYRGIHLRAHRCWHGKVVNSCVTHLNLIMMRLRVHLHRLDLLLLQLVDREAWLLILLLLLHWLLRQALILILYQHRLV